MCLMRMLRPTHDLELAEHLSSQRIARQHTLDRLRENPLRSPIEKLLQGFGLEIADVARMPVVELVLELSAGHANLLGVDHDNIVAGIDMWRVLGLVLTTQAPRDFGRKAAERLAIGVDEIPIAPDFRRLC